jgi:hypothetical protein
MFVESRYSAVMKLCIIVWTRRGGQEPAFPDRAPEGQPENSRGQPVRQEAGRAAPGKR